jgi:hypothetical protein
MVRPVTRVRLLLPALQSEGGRGRTAPGLVADAVETVARAVTDALVGLGVQSRQQVMGSPHDGSPRADVALWMPETSGITGVPDPKAAPARVHVALVVDPSSPARNLARYDALFVPFAPLVPAVREAALKGPRSPVVVPVRLCGTGPSKHIERAERGLADRRVVVVDLRPHSGLFADLDRAIVQLALRTDDEASIVVLVTAADEGAQRRVRDSCNRHGVAAWLAVGAEGMAGALAAADLALIAPGWDEVLFAALCKTPLALLPTSTPLSSFATALRAAGLVDDVLGTLQLAATMDRRLHDAGALAARGVAFSEAMLGPERALYDALAAVEPLPGTHASSSKWEPVGPHAERRAGAAASKATTRVDAVVDGGSGGVVGSTNVGLMATDDGRALTAAPAPSAPPPSAAQRIEDDLAALKAKIALSGAHKPGSSS